MTGKLSDSTIAAIRNDLAAGLSHRTIAKKYGVARSTVASYGRGTGVTGGTATGGSLGDSSTVEVLTSRAVKTEEEAVRECQVDLTKWRVKTWSVTLWTTAMKVKDDGSETAKQVQNYRVSLKLERIVRKPVEDATEAIYERMKVYAPKYQKVPRGTFAGEKVMGVFCLFDVHFGKLAWDRETNSNYDLKIADGLYRNAVDDLIAKSGQQNIAKCLLPLGNDFFNCDNLLGSTTAGTPQDNDGRTAKIIEVGELAVIWAVERLREIAPVEVVWVPGNHDTMTSFHLARTIRAWFHRCSDVTVDVGPSYRKYVRWGGSLIGLTHGDKEKTDSLPGLMALERPMDHAETVCREWLVAHLHQSKAWVTKSTDTRSGTVIRLVRALSGTDAYHAQRGFVNGPSQQAAEVFLYSHKAGYQGHWIANARYK